MEQMYFGLIEVSPQYGTPGFEKYDGAQAACWVNTLDFAEARGRAVKLLEAAGWFVKGVREERIIHASEYDPSDDGLKKFHQALVDGEVCIIYTYPRQSER